MIGEVLGWIGSIALAVCAYPQAVKCWRQGHGQGLSVFGLIVWTAGEIALVIATPLKCGWVPWLMANYIGNLLALAVILRYRFWPRKESE
jgi:uncharacterized protein with PQ loop repeat